MYCFFSVQSRTAQQSKMKWVVNIVFHILQVSGKKFVGYFTVDHMPYTNAIWFSLLCYLDVSVIC